MIHFKLSVAFFETGFAVEVVLALSTPKFGVLIANDAPGKLLLLLLFAALVLQRAGHLSHYGSNDIGRPADQCGECVVLS